MQYWISTLNEKVPRWTTVITKRLVRCTTSLMYTTIICTSLVTLLITNVSTLDFGSDATPTGRCSLYHFEFMLSRLSSLNANLIELQCIFIKTLSL